MKFLRFGVPLATLGIALIAGCSGGGGSAPAPALIVPTPKPTAAPSAAPAAKTSVSFSITIPYTVTGSASARKPQYISPGTKSIAIVVGTAAPVSTDLTPSSPNCTTGNGTLTCTVTEYPDGGATQTFSVKSYDMTGGMGDVLSDATASMFIKTGQANVVTLTLNGDVAQVTISASPIPACVATSEPIVVTAKDAAGDVIIGPGVYSNPITLSDSNTTNTTISATAIDKPGDGATITYDGKSPGYAIISATATGVTGPNLVPLDFSPGPTVCEEYPIIGTVQPADPLGIATGSDGNIYAAEYGGEGLGEIAAGAASGTMVTQDSVEASGGLFFKLTGITTGPDNNLWVTDPNNGLIQVTPGTTAALTPTIFADGSAEGDQSPREIVTGPDKNLWVTDNGSNQISKVTTAGVYTDYTLPTAGSGPFGIAAGGDGRLWFTEEQGNRIGAITTAGTFAEATLPTASALPTFITAGPGLNPGDPPGLWFSESGVGQIGFITTSSMTVTEFVVPTANVSVPEGIVAGLDGNIYFADNRQESLGRVTPAGAFTSFPLMTITNQQKDTPRPYALTVGPDGNIYFTDSDVTDGTTTVPATFTGALGYFAY